MQQSEIRVGDKIVHKLMPGFAMEVLEVEPCQPTHGSSHNSFRVVDPEGKEDWLCEFDVFKLETPSTGTLIDIHRA